MKKIAFLIFLISLFSDVILCEEIDKITKVYRCDVGVCYDTLKNKKNILVKNNNSNPNYLLDFNIDSSESRFTSSNKKWAVINLTIGHEGPGRIQEFRVLFYIPNKKIIQESTLGNPPFSFGRDKKGEFVDLLNYKKVYLSELLKKINTFKDIKKYIKELNSK